MPSYSIPTQTELAPGNPPPPRRRRGPVIAAVAAAAVVVVTVPLALAAGGVFGGSDAPTPSASVSTTATASSPVASGPAAGVLDVAHLPAGAAPALEYVASGVLHEPDGSTTDVGTRHPVHAFVVLADGSRVWQTARGGTSYVEVQDADGAFRAPARSMFGLAVNPKHTVASWVAPSGQVMVWSGGTGRPAPLGDPITAGHDLRIAAVSGDDCSLACSVVVNVRDVRGGAASEPWEASPNGTQRLRDGGYLIVNDIGEGGLTVGYTRITDVGTCSKLLGGGELQGFSTCKATLESFSPDGSAILGYPAYFDGLGPTSISMWDLAGHRLFERRANAKHQASIGSTVWEAPGHLLATVFQNGRWAVVRVASDGALEYAVPPVAGQDVENPFVLATGGAPAGD